MTMDVATCLDPEIAAALAASPMGAIDFGTFTFETAARDARGDGRHAGGRAAADDDRVARGRGARAPPATTRRVRVYSPPDEGDRPSVRLLDPRRRLHVRLRAQRRRPHQPLGRGVRLRRGVDRVPPRAGSTRTRRRSTTATRACCWTAQHADELGIDPARIAIAGASAGGGLAAGLAILARDRGEVDAAFQLLIYPMIDDTQHDARRATSTARRCGAAPRTTSGGARTSATSTAPTTSRPRRRPPGSTTSPGCPPAWIGVGSLDVFRDEDIDVRVTPAGRRHHHRAARVPGCVPRLRDDRARRRGVAQACQRDITEALRRALRPESVAASTS